VVVESRTVPPDLTGGRETKRSHPPRIVLVALLGATSPPEMHARLARRGCVTHRRCNTWPAYERFFADTHERAIFDPHGSSGFVRMLSGHGFGRSEGGRTLQTTRSSPLRRKKSGIWPDRRPVIVSRRTGRLPVSETQPAPTPGLLHS
jgi:hypothetical protein